MFLQMYNPNPVPFTDLVINFENNFGSISGSIPDPVSFIVTFAKSRLLNLYLFNFTIICSFRHVNFIALSIKFVRTRKIRDFYSRL